MWQRKRGRPRRDAVLAQVPVSKGPVRTSIGFTAEELSLLAHVVAAGLVLLRETRRHRAVGKVKAALSRLHLPSPAGL